jgi:hypothetical protein
MGESMARVARCNNQRGISGMAGDEEGPVGGVGTPQGSRVTEWSVSKLRGRLGQELSDSSGRRRWDLMVTS